MDIAYHQGATLLYMLVHNLFGSVVENMAIKPWTFVCVNVFSSSIVHRLLR